MRLLTSIKRNANKLKIALAIQSRFPTFLHVSTITLNNKDYEN